ncbi:GntR family transcriptional regulator [Chitinivorax tropicus]|uniref:GntR family transcriptional regulator n=1 Tax=Chitinivorax tropicus TaxID=714531 RepID=A0A840MN00_9PROT|nr:GntR family transcriptional regulator [Chitinivorax tropicus]MBB5020018.1 GntR family transcriptional regulator [Chitinivorax tropicus]
MPRRLPLYQQIKGLLIEALESGEWLHDDVLPSEFELADRFGVSQGTVRKALDALVGERVLYRRQGKGTFVSPYQDEWERTGFVVPGFGGRVLIEPVLPELLTCMRANASEEVAAALRLRRGASVIFVKRLMRLNGQVMAMDDVVLPAELFDGLDSRKIRQVGGALYELYHRVFGVRVVRTTEQIRAEPAAADEARLMGVERGTPLLCVTRVAYAAEQRPVEWRRSWMCTDKYAYGSES